MSFAWRFLISGWRRAQMSGPWRRWMFCWSGLSRRVPTRVDDHGRSDMRNGFTLIEMVLASAVAALLMAAVLMVVTSIARDRERVATTRPDANQDKAQIVEMLRQDLLSAK